jgi:hypothetical protein
VRISLESYSTAELTTSSALVQSRLKTYASELAVVTRRDKANAERNAQDAQDAGFRAARRPKLGLVHFDHKASKVDLLT